MFKHLLVATISSVLFFCLSCGSNSLSQETRGANSEGEHNSELENYHAIYDPVFREARGVQQRAGEETEGHQRMRAKTPGIDVSYDEVMGLPNRISRSLTTGANARMAAGADSAEDAASAFVREHADLWQLSPADASTVDIMGVSERGLKTVRLAQHVDGIEVFGSDIKVSLTGMNEVVSVAGLLFPKVGSIENRRGATEGRTDSCTKCIAAAVKDLTQQACTAENFRALGQRELVGSYETYEAVETQLALDRPIRTKRVLYPAGDGEFIPANFIEVWPTGASPYSYVVSADGHGTILFRKNLSSRIVFEYRVHNTKDSVFRPHDGPAPGTPHPTGSPDGFQASTIPEVIVKIESLLPGSPWLSPSATTTDGNNCRAYADLSSPDGFTSGSNDIFGTITSTGKFDYIYDHSKSSADPNNLQNSVVGMFFHVNWLHDRWYEAGFDEGAGNAQANNFGRGGAEGDAILAEGNDFSGVNNANMSTPPDGSSPRMQMYRFTLAPGPDRTSNHEALITFHEMGHYVSNRLIGDASGLVNKQGRAMGEGWGDFFAICMTSQSTDDFQEGAFAVGGWTDLENIFKDNYYYSIRRYPYSRDFDKNPLTFKHIGRGVTLPSGPPRKFSGDNAAIHNAGEIWSSMLWEVFVGLVKQHGHEVAEKRMLKYVIGGMKQTPNSPTYTEARNGVLSAVAALHPEDLGIAWKGFARRGIGEGAVSPARTSTDFDGVVESFQVPDEFQNPGATESSPKIVLFDLGNTLEFRDQLRPGAKETLDQILAMNGSGGKPVRLALLSDYYPATNESEIATIRQKYTALVDSLQLSSYFAPKDERITLSTELSVSSPGIQKPDVELFRFALAKVSEDATFSDAIFVTENEVHIAKAAELGFQTFLVPRPTSIDQDFPTTSCIEKVQKFVATTCPTRTIGVAGNHSPSITVQFGDETFSTAELLSRSEGSTNLHLVMQKGRVFERLHQEVRIVRNHGRYLLVDMNSNEAKGLSDCDDFQILPLTESISAFKSVETDALRGEREDSITQVLGLLDAEQFKADVEHLAEFPNRHSVTANYANASQWVLEQLEAVGYATQFQAISVNGQASRNVIAEQAGCAPDRKVVLVVAHLDSINLFGLNNETNIAPGADDNASGTAGVLQLARALAEVEHQHDLRLILFGGEEQGLFGSLQYVQGLTTEEQKRIVAVINMDMIGSLNTSEPSVLIEGSDNSPQMTDLIEQLSVAFATYTNLEIETSVVPFASDHVPFINAEIPAVLTIEGADSANANAHTINDTAEKINVDFAMEILKGNLAFVVQALTQK